MRDHVRCPFKTAETIVENLKRKTNIIFIDFHAEATSEKMGLAYFLDGKISGLVGTHTHVQRRIMLKAETAISIIELK